MEEVEDIKPVIRGMNDDISFLILNVARLGKEIEVIKTAHVRKRDECMRNVVVCGVGMAYSATTTSFFSHKSAVLLNNSAFRVCSRRNFFIGSKTVLLSRRCI